MSFRCTTLALVFALLFLPDSTWAEAGYVIDKLTVGIHQDNTLDSPILKLFTTGAKLEILKREGDLVQVRGPEGETGWMEAAYLTLEEPAGVVVERLEKRAAELEAQLKGAQEKLKGQGLTGHTGAGSDPSSPDNFEAQLTAALQGNKVLNEQVSAERLKVQQLEAKLTEAEKKAAQPNPGNEALLQQLQEENEALKKTLAETQSETSSRSVSAMEGFFANGYWIGLGVLLLAAAFLSGVYWVERRRRKRYGGFRI